MDILRAYILLLHLQAERRALRARLPPPPPDIRSRIYSMTPKLAGVKSTLAKLQHGLDARAENIMARAAATETLANAAFAKANATLDAAAAALDEVEQFAKELNEPGDNGSPSFGAADSAPRPTPDGSSEPSATA
jgi:hypothetical protein